ncbi:MAG TPA: ATP-binding protein [Methylomirabilota bacterium]|nr:ATP-binding protein [Methylomirabilota bacterium]
MAEISTHLFSPADDKFLDTLYNALPDAIVGIDSSSGRILHWNDAATVMFGRPAQDAVGKSLDVIFADAANFQSFFANLLSEVRKRGSWETKFHVRSKDDANVYAELTAALSQRGSNGEYVILVFHQRSRAQDADSDLETYTRYQEVIAELGQQALGNDEIDGLMDRAIKGVAGALRTDYASVLELLPGGNELLLRAGVGWEDGRVGRTKIAATGASQESYAIRSEKPVIVEDIKHESRFNGSALLRDREAASGMSTIIRSRPQPYGVLSVHTTLRRTFTRDDVHFFLSVADLLANTIERKHIERELQSLNGRLLEIVRERTKLLQLLQEIAVVANEASSIDSALEITIDKICKETSFPCPETALLIGHVYRLMTTDATSAVDYWYLSNPGVLTPFRAVSDTVHFDYGVGLIGRVLASRKLEWVADFAGDRTDPRAAAAKDTHLKTAIAFPILAGEDVVAVMEIFTSETVSPEAPLLEVLSQIGIELGRIVERKRTEERLRQNELLVTIGLTAAKLAHEISNPLNGMYTSMQLLERASKNAKASNDDIIPSIVKDLKREIDRLRSLLHEFRTLSSPMKFDFELSDVSEIAREVARLEASRYAQQGITIEVNFPADLPKVVLDREKIKQALLNLCQNAADAMRRGGTLTIRGYRFWEAICLEVHDTGPGVTEKMNVFEIFTTTKRGGTGLGLPIVQQILAGHRGSVVFASEPGKGTIFRVTLPINPQS